MALNSSISCPIPSYPILSYSIHPILPLLDYFLFTLKCPSIIHIICHRRTISVHVVVMLKNNRARKEKICDHGVNCIDELPFNTFNLKILYLFLHIPQSSDLPSALPHLYSPFLSFTLLSYPVLSFQIRSVTTVLKCFGLWEVNGAIHTQKSWPLLRVRGPLSILIT